MAVLKYHCKGLDRKTADSFSALGYTSVQQNHRIYNGAFNPISGKIKMMAAAINSGAIIRGATSWYDPANSYVAVIVVSATKIYTAQWTADGNQLTWTDRTGAASITSTNFKTFASLNNLLIVAGGSASGDVLLKMSTTTGNAANLAGTPPKGDCVQVVNNYLFVGRQMNAAGTKSRVNWSAASDPETWGASDFVDFRFNDGDEVTALSAIGTDLIIFKNHSIGKLSTTGISVSGTYTLGPLVTISENIGTLSALSVDRLPDGTLVFLGGDGMLYRCDGNQVVKLNDGPTPGSNYVIPAPSVSPSNLNQYFVCVNPTYNEIRISGGIVYNYLENYWYNDTIYSTENVLFRIGPRRSSGSSFLPYAICAGTTDGFVLLYDYVAFPSDVSGVRTPSVITFNLPISEIGFIPRFVKIFFHSVCISSFDPASITLKFAWDTLPSGGTSVTTPFVLGSSVTDPTWQTLRFAIPSYKTANNAVPNNLSVYLSVQWDVFTVQTQNRGFVFSFSDKDEF